MPRRKKNAIVGNMSKVRSPIGSGDGSYRSSQLASSASKASSKKYRISRLSPGKDPESGYPIETVEIDREDAIALARKDAEKMHLVADAIFDEKKTDRASGAFVTGSRAKSLDTLYVPLPDMLISMGCVPPGHIVLSRSARHETELEEMRSDFDEMSSLGAVYDIDRLSLIEPERFLDKEDALTAQGAYMEYAVASFEFPVIYQGTRVADEVRDWLNSRYIASELLNCCYIGRGAPMGVDLMFQINDIASHPAEMRELLSAVTNGILKLPDIDTGRLPEWQEGLLWRSHLSSYVGSAMKKDESFRTSFWFCPYVLYDEHMLNIAKVFKGMRIIMKEMLKRYGGGRENAIADVLWKEDGADGLARTLGATGAIAMIDAYLNGCELEDVLA